MSRLLSRKVELDILSGARCEKYNSTIQGSIAGDAHTLGLALDIFVDTSTPSGREFAGALFWALGKNGIKRWGIGLNTKNMLHFDLSNTLPTPRCWIYK